MKKPWIFKSVDEKLGELGFDKYSDNELAVSYERYNEEFNYNQTVEILRKASGRHILTSYDPDLSDAKNIGNVAVGLSYLETKLFLKKMKKKGWHKVRG